MGECGQFIAQGVGRVGDAEGDNVLPGGAVKDCHGQDATFGGVVDRGDTVESDGYWCHGFCDLVTVNSLSLFGKGVVQGFENVMLWK